MPDLNFWFDHGGGDCVQVACLMELYRRRAYHVRIHYEGNKRDIFDAAGLEYWDFCCTNYHNWAYDWDNFNHPDITRGDGWGNKLYHLLNTEVLPNIGERNALWEELNTTVFDGLFDGIITGKATGDVNHFLLGHFGIRKALPRPIILFHPKGTNFANEKNLTDAEIEDTIRELLEQTGGSVVILDWDDRVNAPNHCRIKHLNRDWGKITLMELAAMMEVADLFIGVDSCPFHLSQLTRVPSIGVFTDFFPWSVALRRPSGFTTVMTRDTHHHDTMHRRPGWNVVEYPGMRPAGKEIGKQAARMLNNRYGLPPGADVCLQQMVRDFLKGHSSSTSPIVDRNDSLDWLFQFVNGMENPQIVETGCVRSEDDWSAGYFTYLMGFWMKWQTGGNFTSVDIDERKCGIARNICKGLPVDVVCSCSVKYLNERTEPIDVLYLDSMDCDVPGHEEHGLKEIIAGDRLVRPGGIIVFDDSPRRGEKYVGKGALGIQWARDNNLYNVIEWSGYQTILQKIDWREVDENHERGWVDMRAKRDPQMQELEQQKQHLEQQIAARWDGIRTEHRRDNGKDVEPEVESENET